MARMLFGKPCGLIEVVVKVLARSAGLLSQATLALGLVYLKFKRIARIYCDLTF